MNNTTNNMNTTINRIGDYRIEYYRIGDYVASSRGTSDAVWRFESRTVKGSVWTVGRNKQDYAFSPKYCFRVDGTLG